MLTSKQADSPSDGDASLATLFSFRSSLLWDSSLWDHHGALGSSTRLYAHLRDAFARWLKRPKILNVHSSVRVFWVFFQIFHLFVPSLEMLLSRFRNEKASWNFRLKLSTWKYSREMRLCKPRLESKVLIPNLKVESRRRSKEQRRRSEKQREELWRAPKSAVCLETPADTWPALPSFSALSL